MRRHAVEQARRVVFDHQIFSKQQFGGISRYFTELARHLSQDTPWAVDVLALAHVNDHLLTLDPRLVHGLRVPHYRRLAPLWQGIDERLTDGWLSRHPAAVVHRTYYGPRRGPRRGPSVITVYDMIHELFPSFFPEEQELIAHKRAAILDADRVICISESTRRDLLSLVPVEPSRVVVVPLGVTPEVPSAGRREDEPYLLYIGQRTAHKNFDGLLHALRATPQILSTHRVLLFGGAPWSSDDAAKVQALGLAADRIVHMGSRETELAGLYRDATALVYPSTYEGFGLPVLEAMAQGCPVICGTNSSLPEVAGAAAEYCDTTSPEALGAAMLRVMDDPQHAALLRGRGAERARMFPWSRCASETAVVYDSAAAER
jgi:glycosyltransferase involved in cell wall biosynthesis